MASSQISIWDHVFSFPMHTETIPKKKVYLLLKDKFNSEIVISASFHSLIFRKKYLYFNIVDLGLLCRLFALTFMSQIRKLFESFTTISIHSWVHFLELFISTHYNYHYDKLCDEIESLQGDEDESIDDFDSRLCEIIIYFIMMINLQNNILIKQGYLPFGIPLRKLKNKCSSMNLILIMKSRQLR